jgi:hypothetical protein
MTRNGALEAGMRDRILGEIRRIAAENDGKPPGVQVFEKESGIRRGAWLGRYWARWGDAVAEAGLEPNSKQIGLTEDFCLQKLAEAARHFKKFPTSAEVRIFGRMQPDFPGHTSFNNVLGSTTEMQTKLRNWAVSNAEYADLLPLLPPEQDGDQPQAQQALSKEGWVYLLQSSTHYKIGRSDQIEKRLKQITIALPETTVLVHAIRTDDPPGIEAYWHRRFDDRRANGEWFKLSKMDVAAFKKRKFM